MMWLYLSMLPPFIWAFVNIVDKVVVGKYIDRAIVYLIFTGLASILPILLLPLWCNFESLNVSLLLLSIATGGLYIFYTWFFFRSLQVSDAPVVANLLLLVPIISLFIGTIFFNERFYILTYVGIALVIGGVLGTSIEKNASNKTTKRNLILAPAFILMLISAVITSIDYALEKYILLHTNEITLFYWNRVGILIATLAIISILKSARKDFFHVLKNIRRIIIPITVANEILDMVAVFILISAYYIGPLSLVTTVICIQPLFVLIFVNVVNKIRPGLVPSKKDKKYFIIRLISIILAIMGIYLISLAG